MQEGYIPLASAARYLGVEPKTLLRWLRDNGVPYVSIPVGNQRTTLILRSDLDAFLERHTKRPEPKKVGRPDRLSLNEFRWR